MVCTITIYHDYVYPTLMSSLTIPTSAAGPVMSEIPTPTLIPLVFPMNTKRIKRYHLVILQVFLALKCQFLIFLICQDVLLTSLWNKGIKSKYQIFDLKRLKSLTRYSWLCVRTGVATKLEWKRPTKVLTEAMYD